MSSQELTEELPKPIVRKFEKCIIHSGFIDNIWVTAVADMQLLRKFNEVICFSLQNFFRWV